MTYSVAFPQRKSFPNLQKVVDGNSEFMHNYFIVIRKGNEMTEFEKRCYGMTEADIREQYMGSITARLSGLEMVNNQGL